MSKLIKENLKTRIASDGTIITTYKVGRSTIVETETPDGIIEDLSDEDEDDFVDYKSVKKSKTPPTKTRAQRMREMIDSKEFTREQIKTTLIKEGYDVKTFASEWFRLNK